MSRRLLLAAGGVAFVLGFVLVVFPEIGGLPLDRVVVSVLGLVALIQAVRVFESRRGRELDWAETPDPEFPRPIPPPGDDLDEVLADFVGSQRTFTRTRVHDGLTGAAVAVLTRYAGYDEAEARDRVKRGRWTDDRYAAAFLGGAGIAPPPLRDRLRDAIGLGSSFERGVHHTIDAIASVAGLDTRSPDGEESPDRRERSGPDGSRPLPPIGDDDAPRVERLDRRSTGHWRGASALGLFAIGLGVVARSPAVLLSGVVGLGFSAYARAASLPDASIAVERDLSDPAPDPGDEVAVTVAVRNEGDRPLPDVRIVDGVPEALGVTDGSPRFATPLRAGEEAAFTYTVTARRGEHRFAPALVLVRDVTGGIEDEYLVRARTTISCVPALRAAAVPVPLRERVTQYTGQVETTVGGEGIEFHAVREYRLGDPLSRIDWNRRARTGEFATLEFREERAATVVLVIDARDRSYVAAEPDAPNAVDRSVAAATLVFGRLLDTGNRVGIAGLGSRECWLLPGTGEEHRVRARELLALHPALAPLPGDDRFMPLTWVRRLRRRLSGDTQVIFLSPLVDAYAARLARELDAYGYPVSVITPDVTVDRTASQRLARIARSIRITDLRESGIRVIDWAPDEPVEVALSRSAGRWSS